MYEDESALHHLVERGVGPLIPSSASTTTAATATTAASGADHDARGRSRGGELGELDRGLGLEEVNYKVKVVEEMRVWRGDE